MGRKWEKFQGEGERERDRSADRSIKHMEGYMYIYGLITEKKRFKSEKEEEREKARDAMLSKL